MNTDNITKKFRLAAILPVGLSALLAKVLAVLRSLGSSDVMITGSDSAFVKMLPSVCGYASVLFGVAAVAFCMTGAIYAMMYFGRRTAVRASLCQLRQAPRRPLCTMRSICFITHTASRRA